MDSLKGKLELVGILAVVLSLLLVAYEIRQSTDTAAAQAVFELNESGRESLFLLATDTELAGLLMLAADNLDALSREQRIRFRAWVFALLNLYESAWNHHQRGVISDEDLEGWRSDYCSTFDNDWYGKVMQEFDAHASLFQQEIAQWCQ
jgi:hypothetical protein